MNTIVHDLARTQEPAAAPEIPVTRRTHQHGWPPYDGETYYGQPAVKPSPFDWRIGVYIFVSGLAGAAQLIAAVAERVGPLRMRPVVRNGRYIAFGGALVAPLLLIGDLKTPHRWYNMLRIFRRTSAMSIGSYILVAFGAASGLTALAEWRHGRSAPGRAARIAGLPAAAAGAGMLTYTGALLSSTSTPLWAAESPLLAARFAASGIAAGAAALSLAEHISGRAANAAPLDRLALTATGAYAAISQAARRRQESAGVAAPLQEAPYGPLYQVGSTLSIAIPLVCHALDLLTGRRSRALSMAASLSTLAGAAFTRYAYLEAGKASAKRGADYLRYTQSAEAPHSNASRPRARNEAPETTR